MVINGKIAFIFGGQPGSGPIDGKHAVIFAA
jgi:hypothetical protein